MRLSFRCLCMFWYCLPDSRSSLHHISRDFVPGYSRFARCCLPDKSYCVVVWLPCCLVVWLSGIVCRFGWKPIPSVARVTRDEVSGLKTRRKELSGRQYLIDNALVISMSLYVLVLSSRQPFLPASYIPRLRPGLLSLCSVLSSRQILLCSRLVVLLFSCSVVQLFSWLVV